MNSLVDPAMIQRLYEASQAGVTIDLLVRGTCSLRAGVPGLSDNIRAVSIIDRFLEHARVYHFNNGGDTETLLASGDLMQRNLDHGWKWRSRWWIPSSPPRCWRCWNCSCTTPPRGGSWGRTGGASPGPGPVLAAAAQPVPHLRARAHGQRGEAVDQNSRTPGNPEL